MVALCLFKNRLKITIVWESAHINHFPGKVLIEINGLFLRGKVLGFCSLYTIYIMFITIVSECVPVVH